MDALRNSIEAIENLNPLRMTTRSSHTHIEKRDSLEAAILELLNDRKPGASICPSEAARAVFDNDWREQMPQVRSVANEMARQSQIEICQKGIAVYPATAKGPIRLRIHRDQSK